MGSKRYQIESSTPFSESLIWQLNRNYYTKEGLDAWREGTVPHNLTSNAMVGKTYAELIFAFLKDLSNKGLTGEKVYILELGAGHGRLAFHILKHLERLTDNYPPTLPPFCYVLSDIVESNLNFFQAHPQFQYYFEKGLLDMTYFDALEKEALHLRYSNTTIAVKDLQQPLLAIANYFFDSIPNDLYHVKNTKISTCSIALEMEENPQGMSDASIIEKMQFSFSETPLKSPAYKEAIFNTILEDYKEQVFDTFLFFPHKGLQCLNNLRTLSQKGLMLLSMDKGFHQIHDLQNAKEPEVITHGSLSVWVNYHAFNAFCEKHNGTALFPSFSTFYLELACLIFLPESETYSETKAAYQRFVDDFGPDDFNGLKRLTYRQIANMNLPELISILRLSAYDSAIFTNVLPRIKQLIQRISFNERSRLEQTLHHTWDMYFSLNESMDLAYEIGGLFYDLGFYNDALNYFQFSINQYGNTADVFYNQALCYYQLREDVLFAETLKTAKALFPAYKNLAHLDRLDLNAQ